MTSSNNANKTIFKVQVIKSGEVSLKI